MLNLKYIRDENNQLSKNLSMEYQKVYTDIVCYLRVSNLNDMEQEEVNSDILSMFIDWEKQSIKVKDMIGEDYKQFADDIVAAINPHKSILKKSKEYALIIIKAFGYMLTIDFIVLYLPGLLKGNLSLVYDYTLVMAARGLIIFVAMIFAINYIGENSFSLSEKQIPKTTRFLIGCCIGLFIILYIFLSKMLGEVILLSINIYFILAIVAIFWIYNGLRWLIIYKNSR